MKQKFLTTSYSAFVKRHLNATKKASLLLLIFLSCFNFTLQAQVKLDSGLVAFYPFNGNANDESGNGNNGIVYGSTLITDRFGISQNAIFSDGIDDYITVKNSNSFNFKNDFSVSFWIKTKGLNSNGYSLFVYNGNWTARTGWGFVDNGPTYSKVLFRILPGAPESQMSVSRSAINDDKWHHVVGVREGNVNYFYLDNVLISQYTASLTLGAEDITICSFNGNSNGGAMDDIRIYNRALNTSEINYLYQMPNTSEIFNVLPKMALNYEESTDVEIFAYPISSGSRVELLNESNTIKCDSILEINKYIIRARFSWKNKPCGTYDVILISATNDTLRLEKCFLLQDLKSYINTGLVAFYPFNGNANDESGNGKNGVVYGANLTTDIHGNPNSAYSFDGVNDYILSSVESSSIEFSYSLWFKTTSQGVIITNSSESNLGAGQGDKRVYLDDAGTLTSGIYNGGVHNVHSNSSFKDDNWHHVVLAQNDKSFSLYVDNVLIGTNNHISQGIDWVGIGYSYLIGDWPYRPSNFYFKGSIDDVRIYNRTLNKDEINVLFNDSTRLYNDILVTSYPTNVYSFGADLGGYVYVVKDKVLSNGFELVSEGSTEKRIINGSLAGGYFKSEVNDLTPGLKYTYRAFAITATDTLFAEPKNFTTLKCAILTYTRKVGNDGKNTLKFSGNGFHENVVVKLAKAGRDTLVSETVSSERYNCNALFDFTKKEKGYWDIIVDFKGTAIVIKNGLEIEEAIPGNLKVEIVGNNRMLIGRNTDFTIKVTNTGNLQINNPTIVVAIDSDDPNFIVYSNSSVDKKLTKNCESVNFNPNSLDFRKSENILGHANRICKKGLFLFPSIPAYGSKELVVTVKSSKNISISAWQEHITVEEVLAIVKQEIESSTLKSAQNTELDLGCIGQIASCLTAIVCTKIESPVASYVVGTVSSIANTAATSNNVASWTGTISAALVGGVILAEMAGVATVGTGFIIAGVVALAVADGVSCYQIANSCPKPDLASLLDVRAVSSFDPNDKIGYRSPSGSTYFNDKRTNFTYIINFENKSTATAPAHEVFITDTLDMKSFNVSSFRAGYIKIGETITQAPYNVKNHKWEVDLRPKRNIKVEVTVALDSIKGIAKWYFKTIDPTTNDLPSDPDMGFLQPNDSTGRGQGCVSFTIDLNESITNEAEVNNRATIVFDYNAPILTPTWSNKKDIVAPISTMFEPDIVGDNKALISWEGKDNKNGSGLFCYNLFMKKGNENYTPLLQRSALTSIDFEFEKDVKYSFYVIAIDSAENVEIKTNLPDINLEITEVFAISKKWDDVLVCNNTGSKYTSYQWYKNGNPIQGANEQFYQETGGLNGSYFVMVTTSDGKIGISNVISVGNNTKSVKVYPNPLDESKEYTVEIKAEESALSSGEMILTNVNGQIISRRKQLQPLMKLDGMARGVYLVKVQFANGESFNEKLIVK